MINLTFCKYGWYKEAMQSNRVFVPHPPKKKKKKKKKNSSNRKLLNHVALKTVAPRKYNLNIIIICIYEANLDLCSVGVNVGIGHCSRLHMSKRVVLGPPLLKLIDLITAKRTHYKISLKFFSTFFEG